MNYKFVCPKCNAKEVINMPMKEYTADGHKCKSCETELVRDSEDLVCGSVWKCEGAYGITKKQ